VLTLVLIIVPHRLIDQDPSARAVCTARVCRDRRVHVLWH
jgi:hypothetical protein